MSLYAYVRSKQKVQDKVGPLEGGDGSTSTEGFLMAGSLICTFVRCLSGEIFVYYQ